MFYSAATPDKLAGATAYRGRSDELFDEILVSALEDGASDIHWQIEEGVTNVYFRIDGQMVFYRSLGAADIPKILLAEMRSRKFNSVTTKKGPNGQMLPTQRLVPEFAIEELEPLTEQELARLAAAQLAESGG